MKVNFKIRRFLARLDRNFFPKSHQVARELRKEVKSFLWDNRNPVPRIRARLGVCRFSFSPDFGGEIRNEGTLIAPDYHLEAKLPYDTARHRGCENTQAQHVFVLRNHLQWLSCLYRHYRERMRLGVAAK